MKRLSAVLALAIGGFFSASGQSFDDLVNFDVTLETLSVPGVAETLAEDGRWVFLEGLLGGRIVRDQATPPYVEAELVGGKWVSTSEVHAYRCIVVFSGESWLRAFPPRVPRDPPPGYIPPNSRVIAVVRILGRDEATGYPLAEALRLRVID